MTPKKPTMSAEKTVWKPTETWRPYRTNHAVKERKRRGVTKEKNILAYVPLRWRSTNSFERSGAYPPRRLSRATRRGSASWATTARGSYCSGTRKTAAATRATTIPRPARIGWTAAITSVGKGGRCSWAARPGKIQDNGRLRRVPFVRSRYWRPRNPNAPTLSPYKKTLAWRRRIASPKGVYVKRRSLVTAIARLNPVMMIGKARNADRPE